MGENRIQGMKNLRILIRLLLLFIVFNSMIPGDLSESESQSVAYFIFRNSEVMNITIGQLPWMLAHAIIRKIAHFSEYACLGTLTVLYETMKLQKEDTPLAEIRSLPRRTLLRLLQVGALMGLLDESIQLVVPGRYGSIMDIWIDSLGFLTGMLVTWGVGKVLIQRVRKGVDLK